MAEIVIFDIDGTLANVEKRVHHINGDTRDWRSFFESMHTDSPIEPVVTLYQKLWDHTDYELYLLTGRPEKYREKTLKWCEEHNIEVNRLLMRPAYDPREDHVIKEDILHQIREEGHNVAFVVEDRNSVVAMWRRNGVLCLQCAEGDF
jgi:FMN phosphatase YigB (HAD superfamily)